MSSFSKYQKYKYKYQQLKKLLENTKTDVQTGGDSYKINGPVSLYLYKSKLNKKILLLGDYHGSWENMCVNYSNPNIKNLYQQILEDCKEANNCYYIINLIDKIAGSLKGGDKLHFFYESEYYSRLKDKIDMQKRRKKNYIKKKVNCSVFENIFLILLFHYMEEQKCIKEY